MTVWDHLLLIFVRSLGFSLHIEPTPVTIQSTMVFGKDNIREELMIDSTLIENFTEFVYLGRLRAWDNDCSNEIKTRIARATGAMAGFQKVWNSMYVSVRTKLSIIRSCVMSVLLFACETWTLRKRDIIDTLMSFEMKCYRSILHIHWQKKITNAEIRQRLDIK